MKPGIHNFSEIGKLNKVLLHRLGDEVEGLVPDNFERLLFDDIPYLKVAQQEHDRFAQLLRCQEQIHQRVSRCKSYIFAGGIRGAVGVS